MQRDRGLSLTMYLKRSTVPLKYSMELLKGGSEGRKKKKGNPRFNQKRQKPKSDNRSVRNVSFCPLSFTEYLSIPNLDF